MWNKILGHNDVLENFRQAVRNGRLASTFLFVGPEGIGKRLFAMELAKALLCEKNPQEELTACDECHSCTQVEAGTNVDIITLRKPEDKANIPVALILGEKEVRGREGLRYDLSLKPRGKRKIAILDDADFLDVEGANALLKTLEEPPPGSVLILVGTTPGKQLPTIRSRCQIVRFSALPNELLTEQLLQQGLVSDPHQAARLVEFAEGSFSRALELTDPKVWEFRETLLTQLSQPVINVTNLATLISDFVQDAGTAAVKRRARLKLVLDFAMRHYRAKLQQGEQVDKNIQRIEHCDEKKIGRRDSMMLNGRKHPGRSDFLRLPGARLEEGFNMMRGNCEYSPMEEE